MENCMTKNIKDERLERYIYLKNIVYEIFLNKIYGQMKQYILPIKYSQY